MSNQEIVERLAAQNKEDILYPLVLLRVAEMQHRKCGGARPECIKLSHDFYDQFMESYRNVRNILRAQGKMDEADQIDVEHPHIFGLPIICDGDATDDIVLYVPDGRRSDELPRIIIP